MHISHLSLTIYLQYLRPPPPQKIRYNTNPFKLFLKGLKNIKGERMKKESKKTIKTFKGGGAE